MGTSMSKSGTIGARDHAEPAPNALAIGLLRLHNSRDACAVALLRNARSVHGLVGLRLLGVTVAASSVANPKFASLWSSAPSEFRIQGHTSKLLNSSVVLDLKFLNADANKMPELKSTTLASPHGDTPRNHMRPAMPSVEVRRLEVADSRRLPDGPPLRPCRRGQRRSARRTTSKRPGRSLSLPSGSDLGGPWRYAGGRLVGVAGFKREKGQKPPNLLPNPHARPRTPLTPPLNGHSYCNSS